MKETGLCIVEEGVVDHRLPPRVGSMQPPKVSEDGTWYLSRFEDMKRSLSNLS